MGDINTRLAAKLREALEFFNDHPRFTLRNNRKRDSYQLAGEIDRLLNEVDGASPPPLPELPTDTALQKRFANTESFTPLQMEAALCAWEWMLENHQDGRMLSDIWERLGSSCMRQCSQQAGDIAVRTFGHMNAEGWEFLGSYDWEFVPAVMCRINWENLASDNQFARGIYDPSVADLFAILIAEDLASRGPSERLFLRSDAA